MSDVTRFLETVYGHGSGWVHLSTTKQQLAAVKCSDVADLAEKIDHKTDVYLSAAVIGSDKGSGGSGRIEDRDAAELTALWVDLDRPGPGHKTKAQLWTHDDVKALWEWLPALPTAVVDSAGGWWFYYVVAEPVPLNGDGSGELLLARWARWWSQIGEQFERHIDGVFNPSRIVRAPGSLNSKSDGFASIKSIDPDRTYTLDQIGAHLPAPEAPRPSTGYDWPRNSERPGDVYNRDATADQMVSLLERHGFHSPKSVGGRVDLTRPGKNRRDGSSATIWPDVSVSFFSSTPEGLPGSVELRDKSGASGTYDPFGLLAALEHGGDFEAAARAINPKTHVKVSGIQTPAQGHQIPNGGTLAELMAEVIEPIRFVVDGLIPEGLTMLAGKPKLGKSWLALGLSLSICAGRDALGHTTTPADVLYIALEDGKRRIQQRVEILGGHHLAPEALARFEYRTSWPTLDNGGLAELEAWMTDHPETRLIVIDTYGKVRGGMPGKDRYAEEYALLGRVQSFATEHRVALVLIHHLRKQGADDWLEQLSGSQAVTGAADTLLGLFRERGQMDATLRLVSREVDEKDLALRIDGGRWESMGDAALYRQSVERTAVLEALEGLGEGSASDIAPLVEKTPANVAKMLRGLASEGLVALVRRGVYALNTQVVSVVSVETQTTQTTQTTNTVDQTPIGGEAFCVFCRDPATHRSGPKALPVCDVCEVIA